MTAPQQPPIQVRSWLRQGLTAAQAGDQAEARRCFQAARDLDRDNIVALLWLAWLASTRWESLALFSRVLELDPGNRRALAGIEWMRQRPEARTVSLDMPCESPSVDSTAQPATGKALPLLPRFVGRLAIGFGTLLLIAYLVFWGLTMAEQARAGAAVDLGSTAGQALRETASYMGRRLFGPTETYIWQRAPIPAADFVWLLLKRSALLLLASLGMASILGVILGILAARSKRPAVRTLLPLLSITVISLPSFLLGMFLWIVNASIHRRFNIPVLPPVGYGLDAHLIMPALVLAARPLAQITRVTYVTFSDVFRQDYIRTAIAKGVYPRRILWVHTLRNGLAPVLTTIVSGLRFSLSSLPVVEFFFVWPGLGLVLLQAIEGGNRHLAADLILTLGIIFIASNLLLEVSYRLIDPRVATAQSSVLRRQGRTSWKEQFSDAWQVGVGAWSRLIRRLREYRTGKLLVKGKAVPHPRASSPDEISAEQARQAYQRRTFMRATFGNAPFMIGTLLVLGFFFVALFGDKLTLANPYQISGIRMIQGEVFAPPFPPSLPFPSGVFDVKGIQAYLQGLARLKDLEFPWGSDPVGRDVMALVLAGAKRTLALGLFATLARVGVGAALGILAGWSYGSRLDRVIGGVAEVLQAFPTLLFAMVLILALDIRKGMPVFIIALAIVGWGEMMQLVRSRIITLKELPFIESAVAVGSNVPQIFVRHLLPNLLPTLITVAALDMAGVLLLLAELGFLNIFMGGGARAEVLSERLVGAAKYYYSDVPEWGALLSNIRDWWRSYPWMAWYPGLFFAAVILAFNLWSEGLRHLLDQVGFGLNRLFNRYTLAFGGILVFALVWTLRSVAPLGLYASQTRAFNVQNVMADVERLSSPRFAGREVGSPGARAAAEHIAARMKEVGLQPAGNSDTYLQVLKRSGFHLIEKPELALVDDQGTSIEALTYRHDYVEVAVPYSTQGQVQGPVLLTLLGAPNNSGVSKALQIDFKQTRSSILLVVSRDGLDNIRDVPRQGALVVVDDPVAFQRRHLLTDRTMGGQAQGYPTLAITPRVAERLLTGTGYTLEQLRRQEGSLPPGKSFTLPLAAQANLSIVGEQVTEEFIHVIGFIPGGRAAEGLDDQAIIISAYYDGLGVSPDGVLYSGANDNASGVATLLEIARAWRDGPYQPHRTIIFVAWAGGEQHESLSVFEVMNAKTGFATALEVEAVIELGSVGAGNGKAILIAEGTSYRLTELLQAAARRVGARTTIRGSYSHTGMYRIPPKGGRSALTAQISWEGSDALAHTPLDTPDILDPAKIEAVGRTVFLAATVMGREVEY